MNFRHISTVMRFPRLLLERCKRFSSNSVSLEKKDPAPFFFNEEIQELLRTLTRIDYAKVSRIRKDGHKRMRAKYQFLTEEQLQRSIQSAVHKLDMRLQMPPVVKERGEINNILSKEPAIQGRSTAKYVFTDISFGSTDKNRTIVVREPNGILRDADWEERKRLNSIYFPMEGRTIKKPAMFDGEHLQNLLHQREYEYILDRACLQFEPNDPDYLNVTREVYEYINITKEFKALRCTRHFGPLAFHLAWTRNIDNLLIDIIQARRIEEAVSLIRLFYKLHPTATSAIEPCVEDDSIAFIRNYARLDATIGGTIEKYILSYIESEQIKENIEEGIRHAHGIEPTTDQV